MTNIYALLIAGTVLAFAGTAFAGEPTGRYQGAEGQVPSGVEQAAVDHTGRGGFVTASAAEKFGPASEELGQTEFALRSVGRGGNVVTANLPGSVETAIQIALEQRRNQQLASRQ